MINFLRLFCPELQKLLKPFIWGEEQQTALEEIKCRLIKPPVLHLPGSKQRFHLYSDMCKFATGSTLYQIQNGKSKLVAYVSKRLPEVARNYSITELGDVWFAYKYCI